MSAPNQQNPAAGPANPQQGATGQQAAGQQDYLDKGGLTHIVPLQLMTPC